MKKIPVLFDFNETSHMMMMRDRILTRACARETSIWTKKNLMNSQACSQHIQLKLEAAPRARLDPTGSLPFRWSQINLFNFIKIDVWLEWSDARELANSIAQKSSLTGAAACWKSMWLLSRSFCSLRVNLTQLADNEDHNTAHWRSA